MILYIVQAHRDVEQIVSSTTLNYARSNLYLVNLDPCLAGEAGALRSRFTALGLESVHVRVGLPVAWGGISQVHALLDALQFALSLDARWDFIVNLSSDSLLLAPHTAIEEYYSQALARGVRAHIGFFGEGVKFLEFPTLPWGEALAEASPLEPIFLYGKVSALIDSELRILLDDRSTNPLFRWRARASVHVTDMAFKKKLITRRLFPWEARRRSKELRTRLLHGGRAWYTLARSAVEDMFGDTLLDDILHQLENYLCPDELFLQTYLMHSSRFAPEQINHNNQRFRRGDAVNITDAMADEVFSSGAYFARKVNLASCARIAERARAILKADDFLPHG